MAVDLDRDLVPDGLWEIAAPVIPPFKPRRQGGGTAPVADRNVFCAIVYALTTSCARRRLPPCFRVSPATAHRRFAACTRAGFWRRLHNEVLDRLGAVGAIDWSAALVDSASVRAKGGPARRAESGRPGQTRHQDYMLTDAQGLLLHRSLCCEHPRQPCSQASGRGSPRRALAARTPTPQTRQAPRRHGHDCPEIRRWLRNRNITPKIARRGIESRERLGCYRWKVERSMSWLFNYRRLTIRYERKSRYFAAFLSLAATLCFIRFLMFTPNMGRYWAMGGAVARCADGDDR
ncbi:IS5 family transposase [Streptomyces sp. NPDC049936]|uniref:IS5 family transposase n=1 Tax=Streptomyces sp. NPDC049936 TaxID=3365599 RepID=UPI003793F5DF